MLCQLHLNHYLIITVTYINFIPQKISCFYWHAYLSSKEGVTIPVSHITKIPHETSFIVWKFITWKCETFRTDPRYYYWGSKMWTKWVNIYREFRTLVLVTITTNTESIKLNASLHPTMSHMDEVALFASLDYPSTEDCRWIFRLICK